LGLVASAVPLVAFAGLTSSCAAGETAWTLVIAKDADGVEIVIPPSVKPSISLSDEGVATGFSGVNTFTGGYVRDGHRFTWTGPIRVTRRGGSPLATEFESRFLSILRSSETIRIDGTLELSGKNGTLRFLAEP